MQPSLSSSPLLPNVSAVSEGALRLRWSGWRGEAAGTMSLLPLAVAVAAWYVVLVAKAAWSSNKLGRRSAKLPPGPQGVPVLGNLPFLDRNLHHHLTKLAKTYGPIMSLRLGRRLCVVVSSPSVAKELLKEQDAIVSNHDVPTAALVLPNGLHGLAWSPHGQQWRTLRRLAVGGLLSNAGLEPHRALRRSQIEHMVGRVRDRADAGSPVQFRELIYSTLYNVVTGMLWGGVLGEKGMEKVAKEFRQVVEDIQGTFGRLNISDFFPVLARFDLQGLERERQKLSQRLHQILDSVINQRLKMINEQDKLEGGLQGKSEGKLEGGDFLELLLRTMDTPETTGMPLTIDHVKGLLLDLVMAGMDTTTGTTEWAMSELMNDPETMRKAQDELDAVVGLDGAVEETHLSKLHYLNAVVKETLRLRPAGPIMLPRTPTATCTALGYTVPKGCRIVVNLWGMQRDPEAWDRPAEFRPERFLNGDRRDYSYFIGADFRFFPFGTGRRVCPGAPLADRMMMYALATLLHLFEWRLPEGIAKVDLTERFGMMSVLTGSELQRYRRLRGFPLVGNLPSLAGRKLHEKLYELSQTYGPVLSLRFGTKLCVVVSSEASAKELLKEKDVIFADRDLPAAVRFLPNGSEGIVWVPHGSTWRAIRKLTVGEMLNHASLETYRDLRREEMSKLVSSVRENLGTPVKIQSLMYKTLYDVVAAMLWGDTLMGEGMGGVGKEFERMVEEARESFQGLLIGDVFPFLGHLDLLGEARKVKKISAKLHRIMDSIIDARIMKMTESGEERRNDFLRLLASKEKTISRANLKALILDLILAGVDTTAFALEWAMAELMQNPEIMEEAREEVEQVVGLEKEVKESHLPRLSYLRAVLKETLRLRPVVPLMLPRTPSQPSTLGGYTIPIGTRILVNMWAIQRDPLAWEDPLEFRPERFLTGDRKWDFSGNDLHFFPFGSGRRMCPGAALADGMLMYALASLLHSFDWKLPPGTTLDLSDCVGIAYKMDKPLIIIPTPRFHETNIS
ncbi:hypothetical protein H6P81_007434 [Aristolochia fimbriata]|uniref:Cytochrome P450 n=1 Tax=Aristolochia fimbriata TaxID=158543 RepID=A0AAV7F081_ARIFI|nr:hypothetical protein H6P81_007434 [Aristolochia fimbriata]